MALSWSADVYSPREIARAAGVRDEDAIAVLGSADVFVGWADAVDLTRRLLNNAAPEAAATPSASTAALQPDTTSIVFISSTLHAAMLGLLVLFAVFGASPSAHVAAVTTMPPARLVFLTAPGPGGGGGGGGNREPRPIARTLLAGRKSVSSPIPAAPPPPIEPDLQPPRPIEAQPLPAIIAPIVSAGADARDRQGSLEEAARDGNATGSGHDGGTGSGAGGGASGGDGRGVGDGTGGGTGGGPYRPGAGIEAPRLIREIKAGYTEEARRRGIEGDVLLEMVVRRDGSVTDIRVVERLGSGLDERAVEAVRQWRFAPALRLGTPVDVIVEVAVEFKLR